MINLKEESGILNKYIGEIKKYPILTREEEQKLAYTYRDTKSKDAFNKLINSNLRFVVKLAHEFKGYRRVNFLDLIQAGNLGLIKALNDFDPDKNIKFCSYALWWIRAYMHNLVQKNNSLIRFNRTATERKMFYQLNRIQDEMEAEGIVDADKKVAKKFKITVDKLKEIRLRMRGESSLSDPVRFTNDNGTEQITKIDTLEDENAISPEEAVSKQLDKEIVNNVLKRIKFSEREQCILDNRLLQENMTLAEIGHQFNISRERARQIEENLLNKLKNSFKDYEEMC